LSDCTLLNRHGKERFVEPRTPDFEVAEPAIPTGSFVAIRPNWNCDGKSIIFEAKHEGPFSPHCISGDGTN
jgi:hypothetical protein